MPRCAVDGEQQTQLLVDAGRALRPAKVNRRPTAEHGFDYECALLLRGTTAVMPLENTLAHSSISTQDNTVHALALEVMLNWKQGRFVVLQNFTDTFSIVSYE